MKVDFTEVWVINRHSRYRMTNSRVLICLCNQKPQEKSRPVEEIPCEIATTDSYSLEFSGGEAIFAESRGKAIQKRLTNIEFLSNFNSRNRSSKI
jgi:hypothetical protein